MKTKHCLTAMLLSLTGAAASAASYGDTSPIYAGASAGHARLSFYCAQPSHCEGRSTTSGKAYAGFNFAPYRLFGSEFTNAVELSAFRGTGLGAHVFDVSFKGAGVAYKVSMRATDALSLHARLGAANLTGKLRSGGDAWEDSETRLHAGLGVSYALGRQWSLTADYDRLQVPLFASSDARVHMLTAGAAFKF